MRPGSAPLHRRVLGFQFLFSLAASTLVGALAPHFLVLSGPVASEGALGLAAAILAGGALALPPNFLRLWRYRFLLRALALGSKAVEPSDLFRMSQEPARIVGGFIVAAVVTLLGFSTLFRPKIVDVSTGVNLSLLGLVIVVAASLPLFVVVRAAFVDAIERAPPEVMREVVEDAGLKGRIGTGFSRRMVAAVTTPVVFLVIGSALIVSAHLRRADERNREETARVLARAALEMHPGLIAGAGLDEAIAAGKTLGFSASIQKWSDGYRVERGDDGVVSVVTPLDDGSAEVRFHSSIAGALTVSFVLVALLSTAIAGGLGTALGYALGQDLKAATRGVRELGTEAVLSGGTRVLQSARFRAVAQLGLAIERLARRFRVFAKAQERAIAARKAAARMRGLFFASVSHDLKSPLNAILGFSALVRKLEHLSPGQSENLELIDRRGRELLALIEAILDAARVEAGQLSLVLEACELGPLIAEAVSKGRDLGGDREVQVLVEFAEGLPAVRVDPVRMPRALATFIGHAVRSAEDNPVGVRVGLDLDQRVRIEIVVPNPRIDARKLEALLDLAPALGPSEHRGLALGLRLGRSVVELHGGAVEVSTRTGVGAVFSVLLRPGAEGAPPSRPAPSRPPPSSRF